MRLSMNLKLLFYGLSVGLLLGWSSIYFSDGDGLSDRGLVVIDVTQQKANSLIALIQKPGISKGNIVHGESEHTKDLPKLYNGNAIYENSSVGIINISDVIFDESIPDQTLQQLVETSIDVDKGQSVDMLLDALSNLATQYGYSQRSQLIIDMLTEANSVDAAKKISDYLVNTSNLSPELENAMVGVVNAVTNREAVAAYIEEQFMLSADNNVREKLLAIDYPESLEKIISFSLMQGDNALYSKAMDRLDSNPYEHTFNVLLSMSNNQNMTYLASQTPITEVAQQWAYHQLSGSRLDFVENQLAQGKVSEDDRPLVLEMLKHSEDQVKGQAIIAKYWNTKMM